MDISDKMEKYLNKKPKYKPVDTIDNLFKRVLDKNKKDTKASKKKIDKLLIRDAEGNVQEITNVQIIESEDGTGTMTYTAMHPNYRHGKNIKCPFCKRTIDLRR